MMLPRLIRLGTIAGACLLLATPAIAADPAASAAGANEEWVAPSVRVGRNEIQVSRLQDPRPPDTVTADIVERWRGGKVPILQLREGPWHVLIRLDGPWAETIRLQPQAPGTVGLRIRQRALAPQDDEGDPMGARQWLDGSRIVNRTEQRDGGRRLVSWVATSTMTPDDWLARLRAIAAARGYAAVSGGPSATGVNPPSALVWMRRQSEELVVSASPHDTGSVAVLHWSRSR